MKKLFVAAILFLTMASVCRANVNKHLNPSYDSEKSTAIPVVVNDRYYAQDLIRDQWYGQDRSGLILKDMTGQSQMILNGGLVTQNPDTDTVNISSGLLYVPYRVRVPDNFAFLPPTVTTRDVELIRLEIPNISSLNVILQLFPAAIDGSVNYVKVEYTEVGTATRTYALKLGTLQYEVSPYYILTIDTRTPTAYQAVLGTVISTGTHAPMTLSYSNRVSSYGIIIPPDSIPDYSITTNKIANNSITAIKIGSNVITHSQIAPQTITTAEIGDRQISSSKIIENSVSVILSSYNYSNGGAGVYGSVILSTTITTDGSPVLLLASLGISVDTALLDGIDVLTGISRDDNTNVPGCGSEYRTDFIGGGTWNHTVTIPIICTEVPPAGTYTYKLRAGIYSGKGTFINWGPGVFLSVIELKR